MKTGPQGKQKSITGSDQQINFKTALWALAELKCYTYMLHKELFTQHLTATAVPSPLSKLYTHCVPCFLNRIWYRLVCSKCLFCHSQACVPNIVFGSYPSLVIQKALVLLITAQNHCQLWPFKTVAFNENVDKPLRTTDISSIILAASTAEEDRWL